MSRHATANGIRGNVCNKGPYVEIYAQGAVEQVDGFLKDLGGTSTETCGDFKNKYGRGSGRGGTAVFGF